MFWAPCSSGGWGGGWMWVGGGCGGAPHVGGGGWGCPHTHAHMDMHAHIHIKHDNFNCKWQPPLGESLGIPYDVICARVCVRARACAHVWGSPPHHPRPPSPHPIHPPPHPPGGWTPGISQNSIALELIEIFQFCLKI